MKIALTKKLADALKVKVPKLEDDTNSIFTWTANWTKAWANSRTDDMLVLVNNATRFTVAIYEVKRKELKDIEKKMEDAISNTLLSLNINPEVVSEYMRMSGEIELVKNSSRKAAAWITNAGLECSICVDRECNGMEKVYSDTVGASANYTTVNNSKGYEESYYPYEAMIEALTELTGLPAYKYKALELMVTLDLEVYKAKRRIIVPADIKFSKFHRLLQSVFNWDNYHLYDFMFLENGSKKIAVRIVPTEECLEYDENAILMGEHKLSEYFPKHKKMVYTYDMGDDWEHEVELVREIEEFDRESPCLLEATGQAPPEDVGGVWGFVEFREIFMNPEHPEHERMKSWARFWTPDISEWQSRPKVIRIK